jgi:phosphate transport system protein
MSNKKDVAIERIMNEFEAYANLTLLQLDLLKKILLANEPDNNKNLIAEIEKNEKKLDDAEVKICAMVENTIVLYNPLASDLRKVMACYRMVINLERIGDLVINIIHFIQSIKDKEVLTKHTELIDDMFSLSIGMVTKSLLSFTNNDRELAIWTIKSDSVVDEINAALMKKTITKTIDDKNTQKAFLNYFNLNSIVSNIERIADHATNIAEAAIYSLEGKDIRHTDIEE